MEGDDWTPSRGWAIAMIRAGYRTAIASVLAAAFLYFFLPMVALFTLDWTIVALFILITAAIGCPAGYFIARKLTELSGLAGRTIFLPVAGIVIVGNLAASYASCALRDLIGPMVIVSAASLSAWSLGVCAMVLLAEWFG